MVDERSDGILRGLHEANIDFIVVGGTAAVLLGAPVVTEDIDIPVLIATLDEQLKSKG